jgi:hypothetical protein
MLNIKEFSDGIILRPIDIQVAFSPFLLQPPVYRHPPSTQGHLFQENRYIEQT